MSILICFGKYGGFYIGKVKGFSYRICLGWMAITIYLVDIENAISIVVNEEKKSKEALRIHQEYNNVKNDLDAYLLEISKWGLCEIKEKPKPEDYGI